MNKLFGIFFAGILCLSASAKGGNGENLLNQKYQELLKETEVYIRSAEPAQLSKSQRAEIQDYIGSMKLSGSKRKLLEKVLFATPLPKQIFIMDIVAYGMVDDKERIFLNERRVAIYHEKKVPELEINKLKSFQRKYRQEIEAHLSQYHRLALETICNLLNSNFSEQELESLLEFLEKSPKGGKDPLEIMVAAGKYRKILDHPEMLELLNEMSYRERQMANIHVQYYKKIWDWVVKYCPPRKKKA